MSPVPSPPEETKTRPPLHVEDALGLAVASLFGVASLVLPFGRDQGLYYYVGREWALRGTIPYRDVFDHKTPGIYAIHALSVLVFGEHAWGIRIFDFLAVVGIGIVVALLSVPRDRRMDGGTFGRSVAFTALLYYGFLNFWDTAQSEIHFALLGCLSILFARRFDEKRLGFALLAGLSAGLAFVMKPPAMWLVLLALGLVFLRLREAKAPTLTYAKVVAILGIGGLLPVLTTLAYFASKGAVAAMRDIVVGANGYYVSHEHAQNPIADGIDGAQGYIAHYSPLSVLLLGGALCLLVFARKGGDARTVARYRFGFALVLMCTACVAMQMKFYLLHWTVVIPSFALLGVLLGADFTSSVRARGFSEPMARMAPWGIALAAFFLSPSGRRYVEQQLAVERYLDGRDARQWYLGRYAFADIKFDCAESEWVGDYLREHTTSDEPVLVRGFQPEIYAVAKRHYQGRFFWSLFLTSPNRAYRREAYLAEDREAFEKARPRYVVTRRESTEVNLDHPDYYVPLGYRIEVEHGRFVVMRRLP